MHTTNQPANPSKPPNVGHETKDLNLRLIVISLAGLLLLIIVSLLIVGGMVTALSSQQAGQIVPLPPLAGNQQPPEPRLQASPREDLIELRADEDKILETYGWVNEEAGVVRVPIERAMELTLERGLPTQSE